ncbi:MAG: MFS transporter [Myxococcales bacterium]|jgi:MFS family permease
MFYGWKIVGLAFLTNFISVGFVFYSYGVFFKALAADFGGSRLGVSVGLTAMQGVSAAVAPIVGRMLDRGSAKPVMTIGAILMGLGFIVASTIGALWHFYLVFGLMMGVGVCMLGGLSSSTLVANWFIGRRGTALGLATMGISMSGVLMPPLGTALIGSIGWRSTFLVYAGIALCLLAPAVWLWVINRPEDLGLGPDGGSPVGEVEVDHAAARSAAILRDRNFWVIAAVIALNFGSMGAILTHCVPHVTDRGFSPTAGAFVLSVMAGAGATGKPVFGAITDRMDKRTALWLASALQLVGVALLLHANLYPALLLAAAVFGFGMGGVVPLQGALVGAAFGRHAFGRVMGMMAPAMLPISMIGVPFAGFIFDETGSYEIAFQLFIGIFALSMVVLTALRLPELEPGRAPEVAAAPARPAP